MKKTIISIATVALCLLMMASCSPRRHSTSNVQKGTAANVDMTMSENDLISILYTKLGNENPENGNKYRFTFYQIMTIDNKMYYRFQWDELDIDTTDSEGDPKVTVVGGLYVSENGDHIYRGTFSPEKGTSKLGEQLY